MIGISSPTTRASFPDLTGTGWSVGALLASGSGAVCAHDVAGRRDTYQQVGYPELGVANLSELLPQVGADGRRLVLRVVVAESNLHAHLEVRDLCVINMAAHFSDLKPVQIANGLRYLLHAVSDRLIDAVGGGAYDLGNSVRLI